MDIQSLRYFSATARTLNYTKAAQECYIRRQALRQQIQFLELELHCRLFQNDHNRITLTAEGKYLAEQSLPLLKEFDLLQKKMAALNPQFHQLQLGICSSMIPFQFQVSDAEFSAYEKRADLHIERHFLELDECLSQLRKKQLDAALIFQFDDDMSEFNKFPIFECPVYCTHSSKLDFKKSCLTLDDILPYRFFGMGSLENTYPPLFRDLKKRGQSFLFENSPNTIETFYRISANEGMIFDLLIEAFPLPGLTMTPFRDYHWFVGLLVRRDYVNQKAAENLADFLRSRYPQKRQM